MSIQRQGEGDPQQAGDLGQGPLLGGQPDLDAVDDRGPRLLVADGDAAVGSVCGHVAGGGLHRLGPVEPDALAERRVFETVGLTGGEAGAGLIGVRAGVAARARLAPAALAVVPGEAAGGLGVGLLFERLPDRPYQALALDVKAGHVVAARSEHHKWVGHGIVSIGVQPPPSPHILRLLAISSALDSTT
ncbi:MAG: hypothetical protein NTW19_18830 [Planctomycetota bacterium]|nr:hypothetical protein [Planctomycetota bacterium]